MKKFLTLTAAAAMLLPTWAMAQDQNPVPGSVPAAVFAPAPGVDDDDDDLPPVFLGLGGLGTTGSILTAVAAVGFAAAIRSRSGTNGTNGTN